MIDKYIDLEIQFIMELNNMLNGKAKKHLLECNNKTYKENIVQGALESITISYDAINMRLKQCIKELEKEKLNGG